MNKKPFFVIVKNSQSNNKLVKLQDKDVCKLENNIYENELCH
jgi:hypothetical protein